VANMSKPVTDAEKKAALFVQAEGPDAAEDILSKAESGNLESRNEDGAAEADFLSAISTRAPA